MITKLTSDKNPSPEVKIYDVVSVQPHLCQLVIPAEDRKALTQWMHFNQNLLWNNTTSTVSEVNTILHCLHLKELGDVDGNSS